VYAIPAWGWFLPADLKSHINGFLRRLPVSVYTTSALSALSAGNKCGRRWVAGAVDGHNRPV